MTKSQSSQVFNTASGQNATQAGNAQSSYQAAQGDIGDYQTALGKFSADNPYGQGGQYQTAQNQQLSDTAGATADAARQSLQAAAVRSGQNPAGAIAAGEQVAEKNAQTLMGDEASATTSRLNAGANYGNDVLNASANPEKMEQSLLSTETSGANSTLGDETQASKTPSFWQELGQGVISAGDQFAGAAGKAAMGCWIAARVFGGWGDRRTLLVRTWLWEVFGKSWYGALLLKLYTKHGQWFAEKIMPRYGLVDWFFTWLFNRALVKAEIWLVSKEGSEAYRRILEGVL